MKDNSKKSYIKLEQDNHPKRDNKYSPPTKVPFKMALSSTPIKIEKILSTSYSDKAVSSRDGIRDLPACSKEKKLLLSVHPITPMAPEDLLQRFLRTQLSTSRWSWWISKTKRNKNGNTVTRKR